MSIMELILMLHSEENSWESKNMSFNEWNQEEGDWDLPSLTFLRAYPFAVIVNFISSHSGHTWQADHTVPLDSDVMVSLQADKQIASAHISLSGIFCLSSRINLDKRKSLERKNMLPFSEGPSFIHPQTEKGVALRSRRRRGMHKRWTSWWAAFLWEGRKRRVSKKYFGFFEKVYTF